MRAGNIVLWENDGKPKKNYGEPKKNTLSFCEKVI